MPDTPTTDRPTSERLLKLEMTQGFHERRLELSESAYEKNSEVLKTLVETLSELNTEMTEWKGVYKGGIKVASVATAVICALVVVIWNALPLIIQ